MYAYPLILSARHVIRPMKCKTCGMEFEDKDRLERHRKVHGRKPKISEAGAMDFNQVGV
jgi:predicted Zn-ribbon and HTH transcriptional regulator